MRSRVGSVGHSYGRRSLQGLLRAEGINPILYRAEFFGEKIQNDKIVMYGVVHVVAVDGYSRKIVGFCTMPRKNPITILGTIFRPLLLCHGIWNQLGSDHGAEFALVSTMQQYLAHHRVNQQ